MVLYLSFLESIVDFFVLLKLLQLGLDEDLPDVHHLFHRQSQTLRRITELLLRGNMHHIIKPCSQTHRQWCVWQTQTKMPHCTPHHLNMQRDVRMEVSHRRCENKCRTSMWCNTTPPMLEPQLLDFFTLIQICFILCQKHVLSSCYSPDVSKETICKRIPHHGASWALIWSFTKEVHRGENVSGSTSTDHHHLLGLSACIRSGLIYNLPWVIFSTPQMLHSLKQLQHKVPFI